MRKKALSTAREIMEAVDRGERVYWHSLQYPVHKDRLGQYYIGKGQGMIGLTWADGETLNAEAEEFFVVDSPMSIRTSFDSIH
ncbi:hypothetical protein [Thioalkalivibrio sp. HL-Eb18]|uniref:hypothetical protein n=1 Tax=Thioalkalivibrio sp. HL-Eb18 TaxID=1266913 RepID=UPI0006864391|nr:hypothetical protein [Thioalkalivibrio sp. HL-Eb18]